MDGLEVYRDYEDGSFMGEEIAMKLRMMIEKEQREGLRLRAWKEKFGSFMQARSLVHNYDFESKDILKSD
ncbi:hypothetical protein HPP92_027428 [Vanilla planifolia]|uniref:Uncharacterized protein n=1 Tax=Vanilla planifolia TaxID=51239 RepID=A0A835P901_VANPL|nr:hypothetical protein HPP92_027428 [Vanilla planifolia]KAG0449240.1 hypothetical protein HPP92_027456 [Vanilla planifolia]